MEKFNPYGERIMVGGAEVGRNRSAGMSSVTGMSSMTGKMNGFLQVQTQVDKILEEATSENLQEPDWAANSICDFLLNSGKLSAQDVVDMIDDPHTIAGNRNKILQLIQAWGESGEDLRYLPVFEETYKRLKSRGIRFPGHGNESEAPIFTSELPFPSPPLGIPVGYPSATLDQEQAYQNVFVPQVSNLSQEQKQEAFAVARNSIELLDTVLTSSPQQEALKDDLTTTLVAQCRQSQFTVRKLVEGAGDNEPLLFEALNVNDDIQRVLSKYEEMLKVPTSKSASVSEPASIPVNVEDEASPGAAQEDTLIRSRFSKPLKPHPRLGEDAAISDLDDMIFGKKGGNSGERDSHKDDHHSLI